MRGDKLKIKIESKLENLSVISAFVSDSMKQARVDPAIIPKVLLAVDEACTNIILYAYPERKGHIRLTCWIKDGDFAISIEDNGKPFNPCSVQAPELNVNLDDRRVGGLGIYFMRKFMDEISYEYDARTGNHLTMSKHIGTDDSSLHTCFSLGPDQHSSDKK